VDVAEGIDCSLADGETRDRRNHFYTCLSTPQKMTDDRHAMVMASGDDPEKWFDGTQSDG
jgi:hypothetical protein